MALAEITECADIPRIQGRNHHEIRPFLRCFRKVANGVTQAPNDKRELEPMLSKTSALLEELGKAKIIRGRRWLFQRSQRKRLRGGRDRAAYCARPGCASSVLERAVRPRAARAGKSDPS
jgi:hypothetical protein